MFTSAASIIMLAMFVSSLWDIPTDTIRCVGRRLSLSLSPKAGARPSDTEENDCQVRDETVWQAYVGTPMPGAVTRGDGLTKLSRLRIV
jgi:hypothetical protein